MKILAFFNNKGGVGKTSLVYHLAWMFADLGVRVVVADLDPQANVTSMFVPEERLEELWPDGDHPHSIYGAVQPLLEGTGDIRPPHTEEIDDNISLLVGDLQLSGVESELNAQWPKCLDREVRAFRVISAFYRVIKSAAEACEAGLVLIDVGPNLGAINRAALICAQYVAIPLAPDIYSLQGLRNLGPTLRRWREEWDDRKPRSPDASLPLPGGEMQAIGYVVMQHAVRLDRPVRAYAKWMARIPGGYRQAILQESGDCPTVDQDPNCLASLKHYRSLMPMAMEVQKPMFHLKPADGAIGAHIYAVQDCYNDFKRLALEIARRCGLNAPTWIATGNAQEAK
jgi:chromosome partitioning protein